MSTYGNAIGTEKKTTAMKTFISHLISPNTHNTHIFYGFVYNVAKVETLSTPNNLAAKSRSTISLVVV